MYLTLPSAASQWKEQCSATEEPKFPSWKRGGTRARVLIWLAGLGMSFIKFIQTKRSDCGPRHYKTHRQQNKQTNKQKKAQPLLTHRVLLRWGGVGVGGCQGLGWWSARINDNYFLFIRFTNIQLHWQISRCRVSGKKSTSINNWTNKPKKRWAMDFLWDP